MITTEALEGYSRRELITFEARKSKKDKRDIRMVWPGQHGLTPHSPKSEPPLYSRREFIISSLAAAGLLVAGILKPWERLNQEPSLEFLVNQAKKTEDGYKGVDLSDKPTREKFAGVIAGIFAFHYPQYSSKQLLETIIWTDNLNQFVRQRMISAGKSGTPTPIQMEGERSTTAMTDNRRKKITVNAASDAFQQRVLLSMEKVPKNWNPLKMLRVSLLHEFNHLVEETIDEIIFDIIDPENKFSDKRIEGFRFVAVDETGRFATSFTDLHEAVIEILAKDISLYHFGSHLSNMPSETPGVNMDNNMNNIEQVLRAIGIDHRELARLHKSSNLRQFLLILADKAGADINDPIKERVKFGSRIARVILTNDQFVLQAYLNQVRSIKPTSSQK